MQEKRSEIKFEGKHIVSRQLSADIIVMAQGQSLCMEGILFHPLGYLPIVWYTREGLLRKKNNATLATAFLEKYKTNLSN